MVIYIDISILLSYLSSTSNLALSCVGFHRLVISNGFPIKTSIRCLCLENWQLYKSLNCPAIYVWVENQIFETIVDDNPEQLQLLLEHGVDLETRDGWGDTPLINAARLSSVKCLRLLLENKSNIEAKNKYGDTALIRAAMFDCVDSLQLLLEYKSNIEAKNNNGKTALYVAAYFQKPGCTQILLESGAKLCPLSRKMIQDIPGWKDSIL